MQKTETEYSVFRKTFHVPKEWMKSDNIKFLVEHKYVLSNTKEAFKEIKNKLKTEGYMEDNDAMIHDYMHYMIQDMLDRNKEIYITEKDIIKNPVIKDILLDGLTPDFIIKSGNQRPNPLIVDIYVGNADITKIKGKYKKLHMFANFCIITRGNYTTDLIKYNILNQNDVEYLHKNLQIFLTEYYYWRACVKLQKIIFNDFNNVIIREFENIDDISIINNDKYIDALKTFANNISNKDDI